QRDRVPRPCGWFAGGHGQRLRGGDRGRNAVRFAHGFRAGAVIPAPRGRNRGGKAVRLLVAALFCAPAILHAQLQLTVMAGTQSKVVASGGMLNLGQVAAGASESIVIQALNTSTTAPLTILPNTPSLSGAGFTLLPSPGTTSLAPGSFL